MLRDNPELLLIVVTFIASVVVVLPSAAALPASPDLSNVRIAARNINLCESKPINQTIRKTGCKVQYISNHMCLGKCISYFVPSKDEDRFVCFACKADKEKKKAVLLDCPLHPVSKIQLAFVTIVESCKCMLVDLKIPNL